MLKQLGIPKEVLSVSQTTWRYPAIFSGRDGEEIVVSFPDLPECLTGAATSSEAAALAADALAVAVLSRLANGEPVPPPRPADADETAVDLDPTVAARAALAQAMAEGRVSFAALGRRLGKTEDAVRRLTHGGGAVKMDTVLAALHALGRRATLVSG